MIQYFNETQQKRRSFQDIEPHRKNSTSRITLIWDLPTLFTKLIVLYLVFSSVHFFFLFFFPFFLKLVLDQSIFSFKVEKFFFLSYLFFLTIWPKKQFSLSRVLQQKCKSLELENMALLEFIESFTILLLLLTTMRYRCTFIW